MRSPRLVGTALLVAVGLVAVGASTQAAHADDPKELHVYPSTSVMKNESAGVYGGPGTSFPRPVKLQYRTKSSGAWKTRTTVTTLGSGFELDIPTNKTRYWRFYAPASKGAPKVVGHATKVTVVSQKVQGFVLANGKQCHTAPSVITVLADFYPSRPGRSVKLTVEDGPTLTATEDYDGVALFSFTPASNGHTGRFSVKATAKAYDGAAALSSTSLTYTRSPDYCLN